MQFESKRIVILQALFLLALSCSGNKGLRTPSSEGSKPDGESNASGQGGAFTPSKNDDVVQPEAVAGAYLTASCVIDAQNSCSKARFVARVKTASSEKPRLLGRDSLALLGIKSHNWNFEGSDNYFCDSTSGGFAFNPLCTSTVGGSLANVIIKATLFIEFNEGSKISGESQNTSTIQQGTQQTVRGNYLLLDEYSGLEPTMKKHVGATTEFNEIWLDLVSGHFLTNLLYDITSGVTAVGTTAWKGATDLCSDVAMDSKLGWRLPTRVEWCGANSANGGDCRAGFAGNGIRSLLFPSLPEGSLVLPQMWSGTEVDSATAHSVQLFNDYAVPSSSQKTFKSYGIMCVR